MGQDYQSLNLPQNVLQTLPLSPLFSSQSSSYSTISLVMKSYEKSLQSDAEKLRFYSVSFKPGDTTTYHDHLTSPSLSSTF